VDVGHLFGSSPIKGEGPYVEHNRSGGVYPRLRRQGCILLAANLADVPISAWVRGTIFPLTRLTPQFYTVNRWA